MTFFGAYKSAWGAVFGENLWEIIFHNIKRRFLAISFWAPQRPRYRLSNRGMPGTVESEWGDQGSFTCDVFVVLMVAFRSIPSLKFQNTTHTTPPKRAKNHLNSNFSMPPPPPTPRKKCLFPFSSAWLVETPGHGFLQQGRQTRFYLSSAINLGWMPQRTWEVFSGCELDENSSKLKLEPWSKWSDTVTLSCSTTMSLTKKNVPNVLNIKQPAPRELSQLTGPTILQPLAASCSTVLTPQPSLNRCLQLLPWEKPKNNDAKVRSSTLVSHPHLTSQIFQIVANDLVEVLQYQDFWEVQYFIAS